LKACPRDPGIAAGLGDGGAEEESQEGIFTALPKQVAPEAGEFLKLWAKLVPPLVNDVRFVDGKELELPLACSGIQRPGKRRKEAFGGGKDNALGAVTDTLSNAAISLFYPTVRSCSGWFSGKGDVSRLEG
jgi:hypothetical protein